MLSRLKVYDKNLEPKKGEGIYEAPFLPFFETVLRKLQNNGYDMTMWINFS